MTGPEVMKPEDIVVRLIDVIGKKVPAEKIEFGHTDDDGFDWWAKVTLRSGRVRMAEVHVDDIRLGPVEALAEVARECGLSVRIRDAIANEGDAETNH